MELILERDLFTPVATLGELWLGGIWECYSLEDPQGTDEIPFGVFSVVLTESERVIQGKLWSPHPPILPLVVVPHRAGIRFHAGNTAKDTVGCILVGTERVGANLRNSRLALSHLMNRLMEAQGPITLRVE